MTAIPMTIGLPYSQLETVTHVGMAHFAGSGPTGRRCKKCTYWKGHPFKARTHVCHKFHELTKQWCKQQIPGTALACRHFKAASK